MSELILNFFEFRVTKVGERTKSAITFKHPSFNSIKVIDDLLLNLKNNVETVEIKKGDKWIATRQALYLHQIKKNIGTGVFYGELEVGSEGSFHRLRKRNGDEPYKVKDDDLSMRNYFYRIEMPPDSALGFLVVQRHGRNTAANALQQTIRKTFHQKDHTAHFELVTDSTAFDKYLSGRISAVKARYVPRTQEPRAVVKNSTVLGTGLSSKGREDLDIKMKVNRPITTSVAAQIKNWLTSEEGQRPQIVTLPVTDDPDRLILCIETDDGRQKQLHPGMIEDMALTVDFTKRVQWGLRWVDPDSANSEVAKECDKMRSSLVN